MANNWDVYKTQVKQKAIINVPDLVHQCPLTEAIELLQHQRTFTNVITLLKF